jgi:hypothetical protein
MEITLNACEQKMSQFLALSRYTNARSRGVPNKRMGPQSDAQTDLEGIGAEIAFCKVMNVYPDTETDLAVEDLPVEDAVLRCGARIDVKATKYQSGHLVAVLGKKQKRPDGYVLVIGKFPTYRIAGFMSANELLVPENIKNFGHGDGFAATQDSLTIGW